MRKFILMFSCTLACLSTALGQQPNDDRVLLQGFYWESSHDRLEEWYEYVEGLAADMSTAGIDMIWLPPPSDAGAYEGYLPRELYNFDNSYGSLAEHQSLLNALNNHGIDAIADIVVNHRVGSTNWVDFSNPSWGTNAITADDEVWSNPDYSSISLRGNWDTGTPYAAARDVDHTQTFVQNDIKTFLDNLKTFGYDGWRYDFVHGFDEYYISMYNNHTNPTFSVGENWNSDKQVIQDWIDATGSAAFDFSTYYALKGTIRDNNYSYLAYQGAPAGGIGWDPKNYSTFVENHDTPDYDPVNNVLTTNNVGQAYAYLLTHPGVPCIFWSHMYEWGATVTNEIKALIQMRKDAGIHSQSPVTVLRSENGLYVASIAGDTKTVILKMGYSNWGDPSNEGISGSWNMDTSGNNYAIWSEGGSAGGEMTVYAQGYTHAYAWDDNLNPLLGGWPGQAMASAGNGWNQITVPADCSNIIFSYNGGGQTADLSTCAATPYYYQGSWHAEDPTAGNTMTVYVQGYSHYYAWDDNLNQLVGGWPGAALTDNGDGWNYGVIPANCSNVIFSWNGGGQTADLNTCGSTQYYYNGQWYSSDPLSGARTAQESDTDLDVQLSNSPNPFFQDTQISFSLSKKQRVRLTVTSTAGQQLQLIDKVLEIGDHKLDVHRNELPRSTAIYIVQLQLADQLVTRKMLLR